MWAAYNGLQPPAYLHGTVNHTFNFVDPQTGVTTNHVEAMWCRAKAKFKSMMGSTNREMVADHPNLCGCRDFPTFGIRL